MYETEIVLGVEKMVHAKADFHLMMRGSCPFYCGVTNAEKCLEVIAQHKAKNAHTDKDFCRYFSVLFGDGHKKEDVDLGELIRYYAAGQVDADTKVWAQFEGLARSAQRRAQESASTVSTAVEVVLTEPYWKKLKELPPLLEIMQGNAP